MANSGLCFTWVTGVAELVSISKKQMSKEGHVS